MALMMKDEDDEKRSERSQQITHLLHTGAMELTKKGTPCILHMFFFHSKNFKTDKHNTLKTKARGVDHESVGEVVRQLQRKSLLKIECVD